MSDGKLDQSNDRNDADPPEEKDKEFIKDKDFWRKYKTLPFLVDKTAFCIFCFLQVYFYIHFVPR